MTLKKENKLSILIPVWNAEKYFRNCINSLLENDYNNYEIIIIAGGNDYSYNIALNFQKKHSDKIKVLEQKVPLKNKALNLGLKEAQGEIIIITDADSIYPNDWLKRINEIFQNKKYNVITGNRFPFQDRKSVLAEYLNLIQGNKTIRFERSRVIKGVHLCGGNSMFRKDIFFDKIGMFDETIKHWDDVNLGMEFNKKGEKIYFFKDLYVYTEFYSNNLKKFIKQNVEWIHNYFCYFRRRNIPWFLFLIGIGLFKLFYPIVVIILTLFFFDIFYIWIFLLPWIMFYFFILIKDYFKLKKVSYQLKIELNKDFNYKRAFKVVPLMFFIDAIIIMAGFLHPKYKCKNKKKKLNKN